METANPQSSHYKPLTENWITIFGFFLALAFLVGEALIIGVHLIYGSENPYVGILIYCVGPVFLIFGLLLVPIGMYWEYRKRTRGIAAKELPVFNINLPRHRIYLSLFVVVTTVFLILSTVGSYQAYQLTESREFCGLLCHQVMTPEYTAYQHSPHARVECVKCHIGPGADWFVKSKLSGAHQVWAVLSNSYKLPIKTPVRNLRPARDTCEQCHWPEKFYEAIEKSLIFYANDEENTPYRVDLLLRIGGMAGEKGRAQGIHWHIGLDHILEYYDAQGDRQSIPWVRIKYTDGKVKEFINAEAKDFDPQKMDPEKIRIMDCIDCHNRPSHHYQSPARAVNQAMEDGLISSKLPEIKGKLVEALQGSYETTPKALQFIEEQIRQAYAEKVTADSSLRLLADQAVIQGQRIFRENIFPEWKVDWSKYPLHIGHFEFPGCYRCHDDKHKSVQGNQVISNDCNLCHTIVRQGEGWKQIENLAYQEQKFVHPRDLGDGWVGQNCHECHGPAK